MTRDELTAALSGALDELAELGEVWIEFHVTGRDTAHLNHAIGEVTRESRKYERKLRKAGNQ
jgi:hypothetical protein